MTINHERHDDTLNVTIAGRLDTITAPQLETLLKRELGDARHLLLDMTGVEYVSSAGLRVLLSAQKVMNRQGSMVLRGVAEAVMDVFEITGFCDILTIE